MPTRDINILIGSGIKEGDYDLFFGPLQGTEELFTFPDDSLIRWPEVLVELKLFPSKSQAKKNGRDKEIKEYFSEVIFGKLKHRITILKITPRNKYYGWTDEDWENDDNFPAPTENEPKVPENS